MPKLACLAKSTAFSFSFPLLQPDMVNLNGEAPNYCAGALGCLLMCHIMSRLPLGGSNVPSITDSQIGNVKIVRSSGQFGSRCLAPSSARFKSATITVLQKALHTHTHAQESPGEASSHFIKPASVSGRPGRWMAAPRGRRPHRGRIKCRVSAPLTVIKARAAHANNAAQSLNAHFP